MVSDQIRARENNTDTLVGVLSHIVEFRNGESGAHVRHIRIITEMLLHRLLEISSNYSITAEQQDLIPLASALHDIGKISIPERILQKTSQLTPEEYEIMKTHVENSTKMIRYLPHMDYVIPAVLGHHERYDGTGYPRGLAGEDIPYMARILTIADCFDAMTARRPYKKPLSVSYAVSELKKNSGTQFDPELVNVFIRLINEGKITV